MRSGWFGRNQTDHSGALIPGGMWSNPQLARSIEKELIDLGFGRWSCLAHSRRHGDVGAASTGPVAFLCPVSPRTALSPNKPPRLSNKTGETDPILELFAVTIIHAGCLGYCDHLLTAADRIPEVYSCWPV